MRRLYLIGLIVLLAFLVLLVLYALPPTRGWVESILGPPLEGIGGGIVSTITSSFIWNDYIIPFPNQMLILGAILWIPLAFLWHKTFNKVRTIAVRSAAKDSGMYPTMTEPVSTPTIAQTTATPTSTTKTATPTTTQTQTPSETSPPQTQPEQEK